MKSIEATPDVARNESSWSRRRIEIESEVMQRMGAGPNDGSAETKRIANSRAQEWVEKYAYSYAEITDGDEELRDALMSDDHDVKESALQDLIKRVEEKHPKDPPAMTEDP